MVACKFIDAPAKNQAGSCYASLRGKSKKRVGDSLRYPLHSTAVADMLEEVAPFILTHTPPCCAPFLP